MKISDLCKNARKGQNLSIRGFAEQKGVSHTYIKNIEEGKYDNNPSALVLSNILKVLGCQIDMIKNLKGVNQTDAYEVEVAKYFDRNYKGTAQINNSYNILQLFKNEYLEKNGYESIKVIEKKQMSKKRSIENLKGSSIPDIECCIKDNNTLNGYREVYIFLIDSLSTIKSYVDEKKINEIIKNSIFTLVFDSDYDEGGNRFIYLTSSEKIYKYISSACNDIHNINGTKYHNDFYVALCRPKRKIEDPKRLY